MIQMQIGMVEIFGVSKPNCPYRLMYMYTVCSIRNYPPGPDLLVNLIIFAVSGSQPHRGSFRMYLWRPIEMCWCSACSLEYRGSHFALKKAIFPLPEPCEGGLRSREAGS